MDGSARKTISYSEPAPDASLDAADADCAPALCVWAPAGVAEGLAAVGVAVGVGRAVGCCSADAPVAGTGPTAGAGPCAAGAWPPAVAAARRPVFVFSPEAFAPP